MSKATLLQMVNILRVEFLLLFFYLVAIRPKLGKPWRKRVAIGIAIVMGVTVGVTAYVVYEYKMANKKPQPVSSRYQFHEFTARNGQDKCGIEMGTEQSADEIELRVLDVQA